MHKSKKYKYSISHPLSANSSSGVSQRSVLSPVLFPIFINDLDKHLCSSIIKFADDTKLFRRVRISGERDLLQRDLQYLQDWSDTWQMPFNVVKCQIMHLGKQNKELDYFMGSHKLEVANEERDLGVHFVNNLKPSKQCHLVYSKASSNSWHDWLNDFLQRR